MSPSTHVLSWLAQDDNPAVRYLTARDLAPRRPSTKKLAALRSQIFEWEPVRQLLAVQADDGYFCSADGKRSKSMSTLTALQLLSRCGLDQRDEPIARAIEWLVGKHLVDGVYSDNTGRSGVLPCYLGKFVPTMAALTRSDEAPIHGSVEWLTTYQRFDHKESRAGGSGEWPLRAPANYGCWQSVSCYHGVVGAMLSFAAIPSHERSPLVRERLSESIQWLRVHRGYKKSTSDKQLFRHLTEFFLFGGYRWHLIDVLEGLAWADPTLIEEDWVRDAVRAVDALCDDGRVPLLKNYLTHVIDPIPLEVVGAPSKFLTYQWLTVKRAFES